VSADNCIEPLRSLARLRQPAITGRLVRGAPPVKNVTAPAEVASAVRMGQVGQAVFDRHGRFAMKDEGAAGVVAPV
jgi:hypothetical protein